ncbi:LptF/LptG family permease [Hugenholtzia roseola]|uniref:LptF/LptG family permease n=1 Tax=Hugenholtzia roseola TaxID=1002 RepID=UPI000401D3CF|nr:LptF/LptG family permease [Hugenholtzia roseola]
MLKKVDKLIIDAFIGLFFLTFSVVLFILLMVFMSKYIEDLMGKDLGYDVLGQILFYFSMTLVPQALPLAMLLSSLMAFGNLGEHNELTAIKGIGISLTRVLRSIGLFAIVLTFVAYLFNNYIVPEVNLKAYRLLYDARQKEPTLDFPEGAFHNGIPNWSIYIGKKHPDGEHIEDIFIYDHTRNLGNTDLIAARKGVMRNIGNNQFLQLQVEDGYRFSEQYSQDGKKAFVRDKFDKADFMFDLAFMQMDETPEDLFHSNRLTMNINQLQSEADSLQRQADTLAAEFSLRSHSYFDYIFKSEQNKKEITLAQRDTSSAAFESTQIADSIRKAHQTQQDTQAQQAQTTEIKKPNKTSAKISRDSLKRRFSFRDGKKLNPKKNQIQKQTQTDSTKSTAALSPTDFEAIKNQSLSERLGKNTNKDSVRLKAPEAIWLAPEQIPEGYTPLSVQWSAFERKNMIERARDRAKNIRAFATSQYERINTLNRNSRRALLEKNKRYTYAIACFAMFLIGAPLGAIIKKGGLGMPVLVSIGFFMLFYVLSITGDKWARESVVSIWFGSWIANIVLFTIGLIFLFQARNDSRLFDTDAYFVFWDKVKSRWKKKS